MINQTEAFWNQVYTQKQISLPTEDSGVLRSALDHFGQIKGLRLLDLGCGDGSTSLFFAQQGAEVVAVDISQVAIDALAQFCQKQDITNIKPVRCSAFEIVEQAPFDCVFGSMILHHLEPFAQFSQVLRQSLVSGGKAFFYENNGYSDLLIWLRNHVVGKYGIPKYGDENEFPLMPSEVDQLRQHFKVETVYPELLFFRLASTYLLRGKGQRSLEWLDQLLYQFPAFRPFSYRQYLLLS
jgi:SAM-dependent methyltransferase